MTSCGYARVSTGGQSLESRVRNDPPLFFVAPLSATDHARDFRPAPNNLRVVTDVDHNVHTIRDPKRTATMQAHSAFGRSTAYETGGDGSGGLWRRGSSAF
jgi:hypothetical protein